MSAQRALRGHDPPPPLRGRGHAFRHRVAMAYLDLDELPRAARRPRSSRAARRSCASAAPTTSATRGAARRRRARRSSASGRAPRPTARSACSPTCARSGTASTRSASTTASTATASASRPSSPRSRTRRGASATPTSLRRGDGQRVLRGGHEKALHVSPFMGMDQRYRWRAAEPGDAARVHIESREDGERAFDAHARPAAPADSARLRRCCATRRDAARPRADLRARARLKLKGVPCHRARRWRMTEPSRAGSRSACSRGSATGSLTVVEDGRRHGSAAGAPHAIVHVALAARCGRRCCAAAAGSPRPTSTGCGTRPT